MPCGVFVWTIENLGPDDLEVSIMFTFQNGDGGPEDSAGGHSNEEFYCKGIYSEINLLDQLSPVSRDSVNTKVDKPYEKIITDPPDNNDEDDVDSNYDSENSDENGNFVFPNIKNFGVTAQSSSVIAENVKNKVVRQESRIVHDVTGVLMHHKGLEKSFTLALAGRQKTEVRLVEDR